MKKWLIIGIVSVVAIGAALVAVMVLPQKSAQQATVNESAAKEEPAPTKSDSSDVTLASGRYVAYSPQEVQNASYDTTLLFFHAPWCIECRGFEMAINDGTVPAGVQILKVDYDSSKDLRKQYGVTIQSTFVRVDSAGNKQALWVGYGKDKTVETIVQNTK